MPERPSPQYSKEKLQELLEGLRRSFDGLRQVEYPIRIQLIHRATNAEAEGVVGHPAFPDGSHIGAVRGAGRREHGVVVDQDGKPRTIDPPILDVKGKPIVSSDTGEGVDVIMPASRTVILNGAGGAGARLCQLAVRGGRLVSESHGGLLRPLNGWIFDKPDEVWWSLLFEVAWSGKHRLLRAERLIWSKSGVLLGYSIKELSILRDTLPRAMQMDDGETIDIPERWLQRLPDAYVSEIEDVASASVDLCDILLDELRSPTGGGSTAGDLTRKRRGRPKDAVFYDPKKDRRYWDSWKSRRYKTYADCAQAQQITEQELRLAIDRERKRRKK